MQDASGLLYLRARYLSTSTGRFTSVDPFSGFLNYPASMNPYQYAYNNPLRYVDPSGECVVAAIVIGIAIGGGFSLISQLMANDGNWNCIDWGRVGVAALVGAVGGIIGYAVGTYLIAANLTLGQALGATILADTLIGEGMYGLECALLQEEYEFSWQRLATNAVISALTFGAGYQLSKLISANKTKIAENAAKLLVKFGPKAKNTGKWISSILNVSVHNADSSFVVLGSWREYIDYALGAKTVKAGQGHAYFDMPDQVWNVLKTDDTWTHVNTQFILDQIDQGKRFLGIIGDGKTMGPGLKLELDILNGNGRSIRWIN